MTDSQTAFEVVAKLEFKSISKSSRLCECTYSFKLLPLCYGNMGRLISSHIRTVLLVFRVDRYDLPDMNQPKPVLDLSAPRYGSTCSWPDGSEISNQFTKFGLSIFQHLNSEARKI